MKYSLERKNCWKLTLAYFVIFFLDILGNIIHFEHGQFFRVFFSPCFCYALHFAKKHSSQLWTYTIVYNALYKLLRIVLFHILLSVSIITSRKTRISTQYEFCKCILWRIPTNLISAWIYKKRGIILICDLSWLWFKIYLFGILLGMIQ